MSEYVKNLVHEAAIALDAEYGSQWPNLIDVSKLKMMDCKLCVLGQIEAGQPYPLDWADAKDKIRRVYGCGPVFSADATREYWVNEINQRIEKQAETAIDEYAFV